MSVPASLDAARKPTARSRLVGATVALARPGTACRAAGALVVPAEADVPGNAIAGAGGTLMTVVDHATDAAEPVGGHR
jgi:hypothetical protein